jgi:DNA-binding NarL/FixJ family response regulator
MALTIALADDHELVRQGLRALLESEQGFTVVGEASDSEAVLPLVEARSPQVLLLDLMMPGAGGLQLLQELTRRFPATSYLVLSMHGDDGHVVEAIRRGARGFVLKESPAPILFKAIREVAAGRRYLAPSLACRCLDDFPTVEPKILDPLDTLTDREREVLQLAAESLSSEEIAGRLMISARTVETHRARVMHKLRLLNQGELIRYALSRRLVPIDH